MIIVNQKGNTSTVEVGDKMRGLRIRSLSLDAVDVDNLCRLAIENTKELQHFLKTLKMTMAPQELTTDYKPIDRENEQLRRQGKDYLTRVSVKY